MSLVELIKTEFPKQFRDRWVEIGNLPEGEVQHPIYGGFSTHCRSTMWTLVKILKPSSILEIGSWCYNCSNMMALSLDENFGEGWKCEIHSFDIIKGGFNEDVKCFDNIHPRVKPMFWYPHHTSYDKWKYDNPRIVYPEFKKMTNITIREFNYDIIMPNVPFGGYDLIIIDGDHSYEGVDQDFWYAEEFCSENSTICIDDLYDSRHWQVRKYFDELEYEKYDFADWNESHPDKLVSMGIC